jgi:uncharacterized lipoprotein YmbA
MMRLRLLALVALISTAAGCLSHREYRHIYSLDSAHDASMQVGAVAERPVMQLQRVLIPDYLDTTDILLRVGAHEIHESAAGRFGERLSLGVTHPCAPTWPRGYLYIPSCLLNPPTGRRARYW